MHLVMGAIALLIGVLVVGVIIAQSWWTLASRKRSKKLETKNPPKPDEDE